MIQIVSVVLAIYFSIDGMLVVLSRKNLEIGWPCIVFKSILGIIRSLEFIHG